jgi:hypothetical protein
MDDETRRNMTAGLDHSEAAWHRHGKPVRQPAIQQVGNLRHEKGGPGD